MYRSHSLYSEAMKLVLDLMPSCNNILCKCKPNSHSSERRSLGKRKKNKGSEWLQFRECEMPTAKPSHEEIIIGKIDIRVTNITEESVRYLSPRWKHLTTLDINNPSSSKYVRILICVYNQTCDCNARIKIELSGLTVLVHV